MQCSIMAAMRRVVVTGIGPVAPNGIGAEAFHKAQLEGKSGIRRITQFDASSYPVQIAGEVDINPEDYIDRRELRRLDRFTQLALIAGHLALQDAGLEPEKEDPTRIGTLIGTGIGGMMTWQEQSRVLFEKGGTRLSPFFIPMMIANMASAQLAMKYGFMGPSSTVVTACATGSDAIGSAFRVIQLGEADVMLAGGTEAAVTEMAIGSFGVMRALSTRNHEPEKASRPFSRSRDGFVLSEGAAVLVLEEYERARFRGARIYAELVGFGRSADAHHITEPHPEGKGAALSMQAALRDAKISPEQVGYINAHGTSTPVGDKAETLAIKNVFGEHAYKLAISSTKSMVGHLLGAAGAIEAIASVQALASGILPPTINLEDPDPELDLDYVPNTPREKQVDYALSNSFAFGGMNATLLFRRV
jgi:3-oxoacyl-[acyl-carrier-protein] synthase II